MRGAELGENTVFLVQFPNLHVVAAGGDEAVVCLVEESCSCELGTGDVGKGVEDKAIAEHVDYLAGDEEGEV